LHLNLSLISVLSLTGSGIISTIIIAISHGITSIGLFLLAGLIINKTYCRYIGSCSIINRQIRRLYFFYVLSNLSIPISINFLGELLSFIGLISINLFSVMIYILSNYIILLYFIYILNRKLPYYSFYLFNRNYYYLCFWLIMINSLMLLCYEFT